MRSINSLLTNSLLAAFFALLLVTSFSTKAFSGVDMWIYCKDSDKMCEDSTPECTQNYWTEGCVEYSYVDGGIQKFDEKCDECYGTDVIERYCDGNEMKDIQYSCAAEGKICACGICMDANADQDQDCVLDSKGDNCKDIYNPEQLDKDSDKVGDLCDICPDDYNPIIYVLGVLQQPDIDGDEKGDVCDNCKTIPNNDQLDSDNDEIGDACDLEPEDPNTGYCSDFEMNPSLKGDLDECVDGDTVNDVICDEGNIPHDNIIDCEDAGLDYCEAGVCKQNEYVPPPDTPPDYDDDFDDDGVLNDDDNCPLTPNPDQTDSDGDGIGDACQPAVNYDDPESGGGGGGKACEDGEIGPETKYSNRLASLVTVDLYATATDGSNYWVAGEGGNVAKRKKSGEWDFIASPWAGSKSWFGITDKKRAITALWSPPNSDILLATTLSGHLFILENNVWQQWGPNDLGDNTSFGAPMYAIHGISKNNFWIAGAGGKIWHYRDRSGWKQETIMEHIPLGHMHRHKKRAHVSTAWRDLYAVSEDNAWLVGDDGKVARIKSLYYDDLGAPFALWKHVDKAATTDLRTVWADKDEVIFGGSGGKIWCGDGVGGWNICKEAGNDVTIMKISGMTSSNLYAVGSKSTLLKRSGGSWNALSLPLSNSLTSISKAGSVTFITGINGVIYEVSGTGIATKYLFTGSSDYHPEWTETRWTGLEGTLKGNGDLNEHWFSGDDLAIAHYQASKPVGQKWELFHADEEVVPFSKKESQRKDFRDIYISPNGIVYAVGNVDYVLKISGTTNVQIPLKLKKEISKKSIMDVWDIFSFFNKYSDKPLAPLGVEYSEEINPDMRTVREGPEGSVLVAGNLGAFKIVDEEAVSLFSKPLEVPSVALLHSNKYWVAKDDGAYVKDLDAADWEIIKWQDDSIKLEPEDVGAISNIVSVVGFKKKDQAKTLYPSFDNNFFYEGFFSGNISSAQYDSFYMVSNGGPFKVVSSPQSGVKFLGLHPIEKTVKIPFNDPIKFFGMVVLGSNGFLQGRVNNYWLPVDTKTTVDLYDGTYVLNVDYSVWELSYWWNLHTLGVGSENAVIKSKVYYKCDTSLF